ncbi:hypothetical protein [Streptomyces pseudovenezuelae]|uniref:hypothetical protein n=1 Tax=Streptomyces pseudovenezuelae TaxID=67350 RepID=UPI002E81D4C3|nr:hypothetical protein [Streptomyces pseudovenezuelae]WUA93878.1 hypothetical protein OHO81_44015 [Streptomyces pseudovenezuelae]
MTPLRTPPPTAAAHHQRPFTRDPGRWKRKSSRALRTGHIRDHTCSAACELVLVHEHTSWGWLAWTVPGDGGQPEVPHQIGVLTPGATRRQRLALRWLTRCPARRLAVDTVPGSLRFSAAAVALISVTVGLFALSHGLPANVTVPAMLLAPLLAEHLPGRMDDWARAHVHIVEGDGPCRYLQRLAVLHTYILQATASSDRYEVRRSAQLGHHLLWDAAGLLQTQDTSSASSRLISYERLMVQLADQVAQILERTRAAPTADEASQPRRAECPLGPLPPGFEPVLRPTPPPTNDLSPLKGYPPMTQTQPGDAARTVDVYLLFAHEPYYPDAGTQEINTTVVTADSLLHPKVLQPDGARIHNRLTQGRTPGEIIPLSTLTHELDGGAGWPWVGDWETVTTDLVQLVRQGECDALSLGLPEIARALLCAGPDTHVCAFDGAGQDITYGPQERAAVLAKIDLFLTGLVAEQAFWPGDGLLPPLFRQV